MKDTYHSHSFSAARSLLAYKSPADIHALWKQASHPIFEHVNEEPVLFRGDCPIAQGYSFVQDKTLHVVFRGTQARHDLAVDIDILFDSLFPNSQILVHEGFLRLFRSFETSISEHIRNHVDTIDTILFTGHSLGGGLATLSAAWFGWTFHSIQPIRIVCHTFGCPRVGNTHFTDWYTQHVDETVRVTNEWDPVPTLPISYQFTHVSKSLCVDDTLQKNTRQEPPWYWRMLCMPLEIDMVCLQQNHSCITYLERMLQLEQLSMEYTSLC